MLIVTFDIAKINKIQLFTLFLHTHLSTFPSHLLIFITTQHPYILAVPLLCLFYLPPRLPAAFHPTDTQRNPRADLRTLTTHTCFPLHTTASANTQKNSPNLLCILTTTLLFILSIHNFPITFSHTPPLMYFFPYSF